jgi:hypothetical protein
VTNLTSSTRIKTDFFPTTKPPLIRRRATRINMLRTCIRGKRQTLTRINNPLRILLAKQPQKRV